jgi:hypothetical protein
MITEVFLHSYIVFSWVPCTSLFLKVLKSQVRVTLPGRSKQNSCKSSSTSLYSNLTYGLEALHTSKIRVLAKGGASSYSRLRAESSMVIVVSCADKIIILLSDFPLTLFSI